MPPKRLLSSIAVAICALACAATTASAAPAGWKNLGTTSAPAAAAKTSPKTLLRRAAGALARGATPAEKRSLSPLLHRVALALPHLRGAEKRRAAQLLARPPAGNADPAENGWKAPEASNSPLCSQHFCVHWVVKTRDAPPLADQNGNGIPDWVETTSATAEHVYSVENSTLGWRVPRSDGNRGGGGPNLVDIYLAELDGVYGYATPDPQPDRHSQFAYLVLDQDFSPSEFEGYASPVDPLDVTVAHEYNHVLQFSYDTSAQTWMFESTAVWAEGKVYEPVHDFLQYLGSWTHLTRKPLTRFNDSRDDSANAKVYGTTVWNKWLDARFGQDVVRDAWAASVKAASFSPRAYNNAIVQHGGAGFADEFSRFAAASAEWQAQNSGFPEGALFPDVRRDGELSVNGGPGTITMDHTTYAVVDVPVTADPQIRLAMAAPSGTTAAVALVGRTGGSPGGTLLGVQRNLPNGGKATITFDNPGNLSRLSAVLINADVKHGRLGSTTDNTHFKRDRQLFYANVSTDFTAPDVDGVVSPTKLKITFTEPVIGVSSRSLRINGVTAQLKFKAGTRTATLIPRHPFKSGRQYSVTATSAITDLTLNKLPPVTLTFKGP
jgi:hypothetical protein